MVPRVRAFDALVEDLGSVSITHTGTHKHLPLHLQGTPYSCLFWQQVHMWCTYIWVHHRYKIKITLKTMNAVLRTFIWRPRWHFCYCRDRRKTKVNQVFLLRGIHIVLLICARYDTNCPGYSAWMFSSSNFHEQNRDFSRRGTQTLLTWGSSAGIEQGSY